MPSSEHSVRSR